MDDPVSSLPPPSIGPASQDEKTLAIIMHVLCLIGFPIIGPLIIWLMKKDQSPYLDAQGRELLNFQISYAVYLFIAALLLLVFIGIVILPVVAFITAVLVIIGIVKAVDGKLYRFPLTIRLL